LARSSQYENEFLKSTYNLQDQWMESNHFELGRWPSHKTVWPIQCLLFAFERAKSRQAMIELAMGKTNIWESANPKGVFCATRFLDTFFRKKSIISSEETESSVTFFAEKKVTTRSVCKRLLT
jgi:hypothetical protein